MGVALALILASLEAEAARQNKALYLSAKKEYDFLSKTKIAAENQRRWESLAERFQRIYRDTPGSFYADDALFYTGRIYFDLYGFDKKETSLDFAIKQWRMLLLRYPKSSWVPESRYWLGVSYEEGKGDPEEAKKQYGALIEKSPKGELASRAKRRLEALTKPEEEKKEAARLPDPSLKKPTLTAIRNTSSESYTRVILELSSEVRYETHRLKEDAGKGLPPRIYVDLLGTRLGMNSSQPLAVQDGLLRQVRVGQFSADVVRVVLDMNSLTGYNVFLLPDPYRLIIDIQGRKEGEPLAALDKKEVFPAPSPRDSNKPAIATLKKIVLDPGHGGNDPGAIGINGIAEKDVVLRVAKKLAQKLRKEMGVEVVLTRRDDTFIPLPDRTAIANAEGADLFISLHVNASVDAAAKGIETYYLDNTTDEAALRLAARENGVSRNNITDLQFILSDLTQSGKLEESITLASRLQASMVSLVGQKYGEVKDLGVKKAQFFVLVGAKMPSVLVEMSFITNKFEGRALGQSRYQDALVESLYEGIKKYQENTQVVKNL